MERRKINVSMNKDGHGTVGYRISLPTQWIKKMGFTEDDLSSLAEFNDNTIIIKKASADDEKQLLLEKAEKMLNDLQEGRVHGNKRSSLKSSLNILLSECYNKNIDIEYLAVKYPIVKEINVYKNSNGEASVMVVFERNLKSN